MKICKLFVLCLLIIFSLFSCNKNSNEIIKFDQSEPLALAPDIKWALIIEPYAGFKESFDWDAEINGYCKKGDILQIISKTQDKKNGVWYKFSQGWLPESCLNVYSNRMKAQTASKELK